MSDEKIEQTADEMKAELMKRVCDHMASEPLLSEDKAELKRREEEFQTQNMELIERLKAERNNQEENLTEIRLLAEEIFKATGEKKLPYGIGIRETSKPVYDPAEALAWAKQHDMALQLDAKAFEALAKNGAVSFVTFQTKATATIPKEFKPEG